jgi:RHS repeat-associated protein
VVDQGGASLFSFDGSGNVSELLDASRGRADAHYEYDAFGNEVLATGPLAAENDWRFSTKQIDPESGLYDYGRRFYQPETGRWTNRDPAEEQGGIGLYVFAFNDAIDWFDPDGRDPRREWELWQRLRDALADDALADEQNWSDSNSDWRWHFTRHSTAFTFCGSDSEREVVLDQMYADLKSFAHFQPNHSDLDLSEGSAGLPGRKAVFDTRGTTSGFDFVPDPSFNEIEVQMTWDGSRRMVRAMTLNGHPLVGVRRWSVQKDGQSGIEFFTDAWEKPRNLLNGIAVAAVGGTLQDSMWQNYLTNFGRAWDGREGVRWNSILHIAEPRYLDGRRENPFRAELPGELR